ncbi:MAG: potassium channel family protein [Burkholderiales bacterium]
MTVDAKSFIGLGGVGPHENPRAYHWEHRLHWFMVFVALLSVPAFLLEETFQSPALRLIGRLIDLFILGAFSFELVWMLRITTHKWRYLRRNWLDVLIVLAAGVNLLGWQTEWVALARLMRIAMVGLLLARALGAMRDLFSPTGLPYVLGFLVISLLLAGAGFYWLEPTVNTYLDGLWLAFVTAATVGYGDFVPTTPLSRLFAVLTVVLGLSVLSLVTATLVSLFIGEDEARLRRDMHQDIKALRQSTEQAIGADEQALRRELHHDMRLLREEVRQLREDLQRAGVLDEAEVGPERRRADR